MGLTGYNALYDDCSLRGDNLEYDLPSWKATAHPGSTLNEHWDEPKAKEVYVQAFAGREPEAWNRKISPVPYENEVASVCMVTKEINAPHLEPQDISQVDTVLQSARLIIAQAQAACPGFDKQLRRLLLNKERAVEMSRNNVCWNCGQAGHLRARCPAPRRHYSIDINKG